MNKWYCEGIGCDNTCPHIPLEDLGSIGWGVIRIGNSGRREGYLSIQCGDCIAKAKVVFNDQTGAYE